MNGGAFKPPHTLTIEEAKNADAEDDDTSTFSPKANPGRIVKLNANLSGEQTVRDPRRESNGLGGLIKKVRGGSLAMDDPNSSNLQMDSLYAGYKKATPISSERNSIENKHYAQGQNGLNKLLNQRNDGNTTPLDSVPISSPNGGRPKIVTNSKWSNMLNA
jgi:hypothetical protein